MGRERTRKIVVLAGQVDHGKSTLAGRLLLDTGSVAQEKIERCRAQCAARGLDFEPAFLVDALKEEQRDLKTVNAARVLLRVHTGEREEQEILLVDTPGHEEFVTSLVTGAAGAELALFVVSAEEALTETARKQLHLLSFLGIHDLVIFINKLDLVTDPSAAIAARRQEIDGAIKEFPFTVRSTIAGSAKTGLHVASKALGDNLTVLDALLNANYADSRHKEPFRFWVQDVTRDEKQGILTLGTVLSGTLCGGDTLIQYPHEIETHCEEVILPSGALDASAGAGAALALKLSPCSQIRRGVLLTKKGEPQPSVSFQFEATICNLASAALATGRKVTLRIGTAETQGKIERFMENGVDSNRVSLERYGFAAARITAASACILDRVRDVPDAGRFVLSSGGRIVACGLITQPLPPAP